MNRGLGILRARKRKLIKKRCKDCINIKNCRNHINFAEDWCRSMGYILYEPKWYKRLWHRKERK